MLVQFKFRNFGSFKDEAVFDMRAIKAYKEHPYNLINEPEKTPLLKVAAIYGANASGKSNFVEAYSYFLDIVRNSFSKKEKSEKGTVLSTNYKSFLFDDETMDSDTEFEAVYNDNGYEFRYGFIYNANRIQYEWLYRRSIETGRQISIIERSPDSFTLGASVRRTCEKYVSAIDEDVSALSFFSSLKLRNNVFRDMLKNVVSVIALDFTWNGAVDYWIAQYFDEGYNENEKTKLLSFIHAIDVGIKDLSIEKNGKNIDVYTYHITKNGKLKKVPIKIESDGTRKAIVLYSFVQVAISKKKGMIVDELNIQLHPLLLKYIIDLFYNENTCGQLIYTTHDTTLLNKRFMRRDQIWFISKNTYGESSLYSLAEFKVRNDQSFEKEYLGGVYGGIPELKDFSFLEE